VWTVALPFYSHILFMAIMTPGKQVSHLLQGSVISSQ
jgi:hypothetical protein